MGCSADFKTLTGYDPNAWQLRLLEAFARGIVPDALDLPTGLGKTSVMAIWLAARLHGAKLPRRLVYIVDRRAVVDQATTEAEKLQKAMTGEALKVSTLRGQLADNREWLSDPAASAIVVGTVDMIGSRLLFEAYGASRNIRPYMAGLLGLDTLVVLDEAHLVLPFQHLLRSLTASELKAWPEVDRSLPAPVRVMTLSATGREDDDGESFGLKPEDHEDIWISQRLSASKQVAFRETVAATELADFLADEAWSVAGLDDQHADPSKIVVFCNSRDIAQKTKDAIEKKAKKRKLEIETELLVGARRVFEREQVAAWLNQHGFTGDNKPAQPSFLIATSAGEVGVDMDADHMVCDLVEWERMVQRFGRVNRRGAGEARIIVVPEVLDEKKLGKRPNLEARRAPFERLAALQSGEDGADTGSNLEPPSAENVQALEVEVSPAALIALKEKAAKYEAVADALAAATSLEPLRPALTRPLLDAWSMTSLKDHPGRPEIAPWLRGWVDDEPQTTVIWREHLPVREGVKPVAGEVEDFFKAARPHLLEKLEAGVDIAVDSVLKRAKAYQKDKERSPSKDAAKLAEVEAQFPIEANDVVVLILGPALDFRASYSLRQLTEEKSPKDELKRRAVNGYLVVDARLGGWSGAGMLDHQVAIAVNSADQTPPFDDHTHEESIRWRVKRLAVGEDTSSDNGWRVSHSFATKIAAEGDATEELCVLVRRAGASLEGNPALARKEQTLSEHHDWTEAKARCVARRLGLSDWLTDVLTVAAAGHDLGKDRSWAGPGKDWWQDAFNAPRGKNQRPLAKTKGPVNPHRLGGYRHEFGSLGDIESVDSFKDLDPDQQELVRHLIVSHHGHARPIISTVDPAAPADSPMLQERARETALRFVALQEKYGPWRLAWLEAVLRSADWAASAQLNDADASKGSGGQPDG